MEYVAGGSLADKLAAAPLAAPAAARLVRTLAGAMQHAHEHGIVHRDLKPSNILLAASTGPPAEWLPKVTDFGLAKQLDGEADDCSGAARTESGAILGTPGYMAPEQAAGAKEVGPAADVYALGAILYECLTGRPPFKAATLLETLEQVRMAEPVPPGRLQPGLPRDLQTLCLKCLRKEPPRRYTSAAELADDLGRFLGGEAIRARPVGRAERLWKWARRRPAAAALLVVSAVGVALLVAGGLLHNARLREERRRADANYQRAREAVQRMLGQLEAREMGDTPRVRELQRRQCEEALGFYRDILQGMDRPDPGVHFDAALAYQKTALAQILVSQLGPARENLEHARALLEALTAEHPDRPDYQAELANCYARLDLYDQPEE
jgi:hypothetical protein